MTVAVLTVAAYVAAGVLVAVCLAARYGRGVRPLVLGQVVVVWPLVLVLALVWLAPAGRAWLRPIAAGLPRRRLDRPQWPQ